MTPAEDFPRLLDLALAEASELTTATIRQYALDQLAGWSLDEARMRLLFGDVKQRYALMAAQAIGFHDAQSNQWRWAWSEPSFPPQLLQAATQVKKWGEANAIPVLTEPVTTIDEATAWKLTAFAARLVDWPGIYRGVGGPGVLFLAFAPAPSSDGVPAIQPRPSLLRPPPGPPS